MDILGVARRVDTLGVASRAGIVGAVNRASILGVVEQVEGVLKAVLVFLLVTEVLKVLLRRQSELGPRLEANLQLLEEDF